MSEKQELNLRTVAYFSNAAEAGMVCELLENNGIQTIIQGGNFGALEPLLMPGGYSEVRLSVAENDYERARELYEAFFTSDVPADELEAAAESAGDNDVHD